MDKELVKRRKKLAFLVGGFLILALAAVVLFVINLRYSATLDVLVAPAGATVKIDGRVYENGVHRFEPEEEVVAEISMEGFKPQTISFDLVADKTAKLYTYLVPEDGSMGWYAEHPEDDMLLTRIGDALAAEGKEVYQNKYPVAKILPIVVVEVAPGTYDWTEYRIDGGRFEECKTEFCVKITDTTGGNYEAAILKIREAGFEPEDYQILYEYTPVEPLN